MPKDSPNTYFFQRGYRDAQGDRPSLFRRRGAELVFDCGDLPLSVEEDWDAAKREAYQAGYDSAPQGGE